MHVWGLCNLIWKLFVELEKFGKRRLERQKLDILISFARKNLLVGLNKRFILNAVSFVEQKTKININKLVKTAQGTGYSF